MHRSNAGWWVAFLVAMFVGLSIILLKAGEDPEPPPVGVDPSELTTEPPRAPKEPGDATVEVVLTATNPVDVCMHAPTAVREEDRKPCVKGVREFRRSFRVEGPLMSAWVGAQIGPHGGTATCRILLDGEVRHEVSGKGAYKGAYCTVIAKVS